MCSLCDPPRSESTRPALISICRAFHAYFDLCSFPRLMPFFYAGVVYDALRQLVITSDHLSTLPALSFCYRLFPLYLYHIPYTISGEYQTNNQKTFQNSVKKYLTIFLRSRYALVCYRHSIQQIRLYRALSGSLGSHVVLNHTRYRR